jgi:hypothetical protein
MKTTSRLITFGAIAFALVGCGSSTTPTTPSTANLNANTIEFAVGTVNLFGTANGALNVAVAYRQPNGKSATLLNSPTLTLPSAITVAASAIPASYDACSTVLRGPAAGETTSMTSSSQNPGTTAVTTFGQSGGVFGLGIEPFNAQAQADCTPAGISATGVPFQVPPYPVPLYDARDGAPSIAPGVTGAYSGNTDPNLFVPWGGPPAFSLIDSGNDSVVGNSHYPTGTKGISEGLDVFQGVAAVAGGAYSLSINVPATNGGTTGGVTQTASFTLPAALTNLGNATAPAFVPDASGGGTFAFVMPAGATQAYLQITDYGPDNTGTVACNGSGTGDTNSAVGNGGGNAIYYTIEATASGTLTLPDAIGPGGAPSVCTAALNTAANGGTATDADEIAIQVIGFDYDAFDATYNNANPSSLTNATPKLFGTTGAADMTISPAICQQGVGACTVPLPLLKARLAFPHGVMRR